MEELSSILFYSLEKAIKSYRQFAQRAITENGFNITIDQWLVLKTISSDAEQSQQQMAKKVFNDRASLTRMIELLVQKDYLCRKTDSGDRRRYRLSLTSEAVRLLDHIQPLIERNRAVALRHFSPEMSAQLKKMLDMISANCTRQEAHENRRTLHKSIL